MQNKPTNHLPVFFNLEVDGSLESTIVKLVYNDHLIG